METFDFDKVAELIDEEKQRYTRFLSYEDLRSNNWKLQEDNYDLVRIETVGHGADWIPHPDYPDSPIRVMARRPIEAMIISSPEKEDERPYVLIQMEHENELIATLAIQLMGEVLCKRPELLDELGYNVILLNTTHPDGIALQKWTEAKEFTPLNYALGFFRSAPSEQVAWGYPLGYKGAVIFDTPPPEAKASMRIMEKYRPRVLYSVHGIGVSDAYFYLSHPSDALMEDLERATTHNGRTLQQGESEVGYIPKIGPGMYGAIPTAAAERDHLQERKQGSMSWKQGATSTDYLRSLVENPFVVAGEMPYFAAQALQDLGLTDMTRRETKLIHIDNEQKMLGRIASYYTQLEPLTINHEVAAVGRLARSIEWWHRDLIPIMHASKKSALGSPEFDRQATVAEAFSSIQHRDFLGSHYLGEVHNLADILGQQSIADEIRGEVKEIIDDINEVSPLRVLSLANSVGAQALSGFAMLPHQTCSKGFASFSPVPL
jgi:hypothetical protein